MKKFFQLICIAIPVFILESAAFASAKVIDKTTSNAVASTDGKKSAQTKRDPSLVIQTIQKYNQTALVISETEKIVESDLLEKKTTYIGKIYLAKGKFRWNTEKPDVSQVIFDGQYVYSVQDGQAVRSQVTEKVKQQSLMAILFEPKKIQSRFEVIEEKTAKAEKTSGDEATFNLKPKSKDMDVSDLKISILKNSKTIKSISYRDEVGNLVIIQFKATEFKSKPDPSQFSYKAKPGEKITDLI